MKTVFVIDDDTHSEALSKHNTFEEALGEIKRLASMSWEISVVKINAKGVCWLFPSGDADRTDMDGHSGA